ncbi:LuxR C-terminal-related transcriptional regulator [Kibdelosporangium philippinense]|uniref:LuxR C-terminal-related transcriptional regulator n=1 Tax=Kibdelosporangium philippinense TaxID=211113 RepID=A0ABS8Z6N9_9PSEU|nr:LuxR C-terminal-related transcriptional regulator [Kibdelosporangium philippinense]MCE7002238.1 LuxR C-terminal-related transcriptional regulator [Kibdelosporangium philippinense]
MKGAEGNLPAEVSSLVGRHREVVEVKRLLSAARLVTLTGVGGVGKTRLAIRVAQQVRRAYVNGVWLVEFAALQDSVLVARTVVDALGICDRSTRLPLATLAESLADKQLLLVLDNCEHVVEPCAELVTTVLAAAPGVRVLATSRHALRSEGEHIFRVSPLPLPDLRDGVVDGELGRNDAMSLFVQRARAVVPDLRVDGNGQSVIARICCRLEGLPLAIEMAAARVRVVTAEQILRRLDDRFRFLVGGCRSVLPRHQTLAAVIGWSYALCTPAEQVLWARMSVFAGGFDLTAAQTVCAGDGIEPDQVIDLVDGLVDKSVLTRELHGTRARFRMLDALREYGRHELRELGEVAELCRRHRDYYLRLAERNEQEWFGPGQADIFERTRLEHANLRAALEFCLSGPGQARIGLCLAGTLWFYWAGCGILGEGRHWLDWALSADTRPSQERAKALWVNGYVSTLQGDVTSAVKMLEECRDYALQVGDEVALAYATHRLGCNALVRDDLVVARELFEEAQAQYLRLGEMNSNVLMAWAELAVTAVFRADLDGAAAICQEACAIGDKYGERWANAYVKYAQAVIALSRGKHAEATSHGRHCLQTLRTFDDLLGIALAIEVLAWSAAAQGMPDRAGVLLGAAARIWPSVGYPMFGSKSFGAPHQQCMAATRRALGDAEFDAAFGRGKAFTIDEAITYTLDEDTPPQARTPAPQLAASLTRREHQVAELIAEGQSNKEIAATLVIALRTAEGHVQRVLAKLGFTNRAQLASWVVEQRHGRTAGGG